MGPDEREIREVHSTWISAVNARDGLQQTVADLMQVVRAIQGGIDVNGDGSVALDPHRRVDPPGDRCHAEKTRSWLA